MREELDYVEIVAVAVTIAVTVGSIFVLRRAPESIQDLIMVIAIGVAVGTTVGRIARWWDDRRWS